MSSTETTITDLSSPSSPRNRRPVLISAAVLLAVILAVALYAVSRPQGTRLTAYFNQAVGVYPGSDLRVLGVKVGEVDSVQPQGKQVKVTMTVDHGVDVPAGVNAVVVAPSIVADRFIQLTPAYTGGPRIADHAVIPATNTATPVELDQLYDSISRFAKALGPNGANRAGALSEVLKIGADNLAGNGKSLGDLIDDFGQATKTLSGSEDDLFTTLTNLQQFTSMLKASDGQVRELEQRLSQVNGFLADDRQNLGGALNQLSIALADVQRFIHDNRALLKSNVTKLASITQILVNERKSLAEAMDTVPLAADNVLNAYDPQHQTLNGRGDLNELSMGGPLVVPLSDKSAGGQVCTVTGASKKLRKLCRKYQMHPTDLAPVSTAKRSLLPPLPLPPVGPVYGSGGR